MCCIAGGPSLSGRERAENEGIRFKENKGQLKIGIINLMPFKEEVEYQFYAVLGRFGISVEVEFLYPESHNFKNTSGSYIKDNYYPMSELKNRNYDGIIMTGAPVELLDFQDVNYWNEITDFIKSNQLPVIYICWGAQAALYVKYGIKKHSLKEKLFGIFRHRTNKNPFISGEFMAPHSRNTQNNSEDIKNAGLKILAESDEAGVYISSDSEYREFYISGHGEYQRERLQYEYSRDQKLFPKNYFPEDNPEKEPFMNWDSHRKEFYYNWLKYIKEKKLSNIQNNV